MTRALRTFLASGLLGLAACGGSGSIELMLMDAPPSGVTAVNLFVTALELHVTGSKGSDTFHAVDDASIDADGKWERQPVGSTKWHTGQISIAGPPSAWLASIADDGSGPW